MTVPPARALPAPARLPAGSQAAALGLLAVALLAIPVWRRGSQQRAELPPTITRESADTISFPARVESGQFHRRLIGLSGYHFLVHGGGSAAAAALGGRALAPAPPRREFAVVGVVPRRAAVFAAARGAAPPAATPLPPRLAWPL